jgi:hypothetical protein
MLRHILLFKNPSSVVVKYMEKIIREHTKIFISEI